MKTKRKIVLTLFIIAIILLIIGVSLIIINRQDTSSSFQQRATNYVEDLSNEIINGTSKNNLLKLLKQEDYATDGIITGNDMFLMSNFTNQQIANYNLTDYIQTSETLRYSLEKEIKNNFDYRIESIDDTNEGTEVTILYKSFNFYSYFNDLGVIQGELLTLAGYNINDMPETDLALIDSYKAKIISANILNQYLDTYKTDSYLLSTIIFVNNKSQDSSEYFLNYFNSLKGIDYDQVSLTEDDASLNALLSNIDITNPLALTI